MKTELMFRSENRSDSNAQEWTFTQRTPWESSNVKCNRSLHYFGFLTSAPRCSLFLSAPARSGAQFTGCWERSRSDNPRRQSADWEPQCVRKLLEVGENYCCPVTLPGSACLEDGHVTAQATNVPSGLPFVQRSLPGLERGVSSKIVF